MFLLDTFRSLLELVKAVLMERAGQFTRSIDIHQDPWIWWCQRFYVCRSVTKRY